MIATTEPKPTNGARSRGQVQVPGPGDRSGGQVQAENLIKKPLASEGFSVVFVLDKRSITLLIYQLRHHQTLLQRQESQVLLQSPLRLPQVLLQSPLRLPQVPFQPLQAQPHQQELQ
jgi:hypothetical protein